MDGTFLDHYTYSYDKAIPAVKKIIKNKIPLVFVSSRVRNEINLYYKKIRIKYPFISENGISQINMIY